MAKKTSTDDKIKELLKSYDNSWDVHTKKKDIDPPKPYPVHQEAPTHTGQEDKEIQEPFPESEQKRLPPLDEKDITKEHILAVLDALMNFDVVAVQDARTGCSNLQDLTLAERMCIKAVKIKELVDKGSKYGEIIEIQFWDKISAIEMLGKFKKMFSDQTIVNNNTMIITDRLRQAEQTMDLVDVANQEVITVPTAREVRALPTAEEGMQPDGTR